MASSSKTLPKEDQQDRAAQEIGLSVISDPKVYELLYNIVMEAHASGAVVLITAILPPTSSSTEGEVGTSSSTCDPKSGICPK